MKGLILLTVIVLLFISIPVFCADFGQSGIELDNFQPGILPVEIQYLEVETPTTEYVLADGVVYDLETIEADMTENNKSLTAISYNLNMRSNLYDFGKLVFTTEFG